MARQLSDVTKDGILKLINDPNFDIREDGTVWRRVGNPDTHGNIYIEYPMPSPPGSHRKTVYRSLPIKYLVFAKYKGRLPEEGKHLAHKDRDVTNNSFSNLIEADKMVYENRQRQTIEGLSFDDILAIKEDHANGVSPERIVSRHSVARTIVEDILGLPSTRRPNRNDRQRKG